MTKEEKEKILQAIQELRDMMIGRLDDLIKQLKEMHRQNLTEDHAQRIEALDRKVG